MSKWVDYLRDDVRERLGGCCNTKKDLPHLVNTRWKYLQDKGKDKEGFTKEDALVQVLEWLDANGQWELGDLTRDEYLRLAE